jgi:hypothetical protein
MSRPVRESCPVLSKREREQNRSLHSCSKNFRTGLEQLEQFMAAPISTCSQGIEQVKGKRAFFRGGKKTTCSNGFRTGQNALSKIQPILAFVIPEIAPALCINSPLVSPRESYSLSRFMTCFEVAEMTILLRMNRLIYEP